MVAHVGTAIGITGSQLVGGGTVRVASLCSLLVFAISPWARRSHISSKVLGIHEIELVINSGVSAGHSSPIRPEPYCGGDEDCNRPHFHDPIRELSSAGSVR